jgi:hypothetical protein
MVVVPFEVYAAIKVAHPIFCEFIFDSYTFNEVVNIFLLLIFHTKVVNHWGKWDWTCCKFPQARGLLAFVISMGHESFLQELVCQDSCLGEAPDCPAHFHIYGHFVPCILDHFG